VQPRSFDQLASAVRPLPRTKNEYETTKAFAEKQASALEGVGSNWIISVPFDPKYALYDADQGRLKIQSYSVKNLNTEYEGVFGYGEPLYGFTRPPTSAITTWCFRAAT